METERFGVNSTVGLGGLFDPATHWKIRRSDRDFGENFLASGVPGRDLLDAAAHRS